MRNEAKKYLIQKGVLATFAFLICLRLNAVQGPSSRRVTAAGPVSRNDTNTLAFQKTRNAVAIIEGQRVYGVSGSGTGFLCEMNGVKYFVTNRHVANQRGRITALFEDGEKMLFSFNTPMEMAVNRDLVRFKVKTTRPALKIATDVPNIGDVVEFYGNAGGKGVITVTSGKVLAVGYDSVEIDSPIQSGNSGSPLVRVSDGKLIGVTTLSIYNNRDGDLSKIGTRYDPAVKLTREFAVRFTGVEWSAMTYGQFLKWVNTRDDFHRFVFEVLENVCFKKKLMIYKSDLADLHFDFLPKLNEQLEKIAECDEKLRNVKKKYDEMIQRNKSMRTGSIGYYRKSDFDRVIASYKDRMIQCLRVRPEVINSVMLWVDSLYLTQDECDIYTEYLNLKLKQYNEENEMQLKGFDLPSIPENPEDHPFWGSRIRTSPPFGPNCFR